MPGSYPPALSQARAGQITATLRLVWISVAFGVLSGTVSVLTGLHGRSLSVLATPCPGRTRTRDGQARPHDR